MPFLPIGPRLATDRRWAGSSAHTYLEEDQNMRYITLVAAALLVAACSGGGNRGNAGNMTDTSAGAVSNPASPGATTSTGAQMDTTGMSHDTSMRHDTSGAMSHDTSGAAGATSHDTGSSH